MRILSILYKHLTYKHWAELEGAYFGVHSGTVETYVSVKNDSYLPMTVRIIASVNRADGSSFYLPSKKDITIQSTETKGVVLNMNISDIPNHQRGDWLYLAEVSDANTGSLLNRKVIPFEVGHKISEVPLPGSVEITGVRWGYKPVPTQDATIWRTLEHLECNQGLVPIMITWQNNTNEPLKSDVSTEVTMIDRTRKLRYLQGNDVVVYPGQSNAVLFELPVINVPPENQGEWVLDIKLRTEYLSDGILHLFTVGTQYIEPDPPQDVAVWEIAKGYTPHHLPDTFEGVVELDKLTPPKEIQAVWEYDDSNEWIFWAPDAPGNTMNFLWGGKVADYMVTATGDCTWEIPLGESRGGYLEMDKDSLRLNLEEGMLTEDWWDFDDDYRRKLAIKITQWFSVEEFGEPKYIIKSAVKPIHDPKRLEYPHQRLAQCHEETALRYMLIDGQHRPEADYWYYTKQHGEYEWRCANQDKPFGLPVYSCSVNWEGYGHRVCALRVGEDTSLMASWVFFQFQEADIKVGDNQIQAPGNCSVSEIQGFKPGFLLDLGNMMDGTQNIVGRWEY